ncbi:MAG TPA: FAD-dependent oxidoreductase [Vicinamibacterales bacterium]|nr:FAD-dependent oxidoreductase [Vicinamibacterales bacterium]
MQARDFDALGSTAYDVLVVGGGIHGLATALDAAARGLRVALVEAGDFAAAASFNHQRTAHGGLRSLQSGRLGHARQSIYERRALARIAPRLLRPLPFMVGTYRSLIRSRLALRAAFRLDRWLGRHRNDGLEPELHLPPAKLVSRAATLKLFPGIRQDGLTGGANWYDYQIVHTNRLAIAFAEGAAARGARLLNHASAVAALKDPGGRVTGMRVRDGLTGNEIDVHARVTINCAGAGVNRVLALFGVRREIPLAKAMNLVTSKPASDIALAAPAGTRTGKAGRFLTLVPWHGRALIGTWHSHDFRTAADLGVDEAEVAELVDAANSAFPALKMTRGDVTLVHRGIVPAFAQRAGSGRPAQAELLASPKFFDHARDGVAGAMTVVGVKYTTARAVGARAAALAAKALGGSTRTSDTATAMLPGAGIADHEALTIETARAVGLELAPPIIRRLTGIYGDRCAAIVRLMAERSDWRMPLVPGRPIVGAEVVHAIRAEMACTLADVVIRRSELGAMEHPGDDLVAACARIAAEELVWDAARQEAEVAAVTAFYA